MKKIISMLSALALFFCCTMVPVSAYDSTFSDQNESVVADSELIPLDVNDALTNGIYSDDGQFLLYDDCLFVVEDLERAQADLMESSAMPYAANSDTYTYGRYKYTYASSSIFYSRGKQHVLGRITLNPGQTGTFGVGQTFEISYEMACGVEANGVSISSAAGYSESYSVNREIDVENTDSTRKTAVLSCVFNVHNYKTYDRGFLLNQNDYIGMSQIYEPYSIYTYWE